MADGSGLGGSGEGRGSGNAQLVRAWIEPVGRLGYCAKGVLYVLIGGLAARAAYGLGGATTGSEGALRRIMQLQHGHILLLAVGVGLAAYALWRFVQAWMDTDNQGSGIKGLAVRAAYIAIGMIHLSLAGSAAALMLRGTGGSGPADDSMQRWTAWLLSQPFGRWGVASVAASILGVGLIQFYQAYRATFREHLKLQEMSHVETDWTVGLGRVGLAARGVIFCVSGALLGVAAIQSDPSDAGGLDGALEALEQQAFAPWLFGVVALGLAVYGVFQFLLARYRRIVIR